MCCGFSWFGLLRLVVDGVGVGCRRLICVLIACLVVCLVFVDCCFLLDFGCLITGFGYFAVLVWIFYGLCLIL